MESVGESGVGEVQPASIRSAEPVTTHAAVRDELDMGPPRGAGHTKAILAALPVGSLPDGRSALSIPSHGTRLKPSMSMGVTILRGDEPLDEAIARADHAMYESKRRAPGQITAT